MSSPHTEVQVFHETGVWVKPPGALAVDTVFVGATSHPGEWPVTTVRVFAADDLPATVKVQVNEVLPPGAKGCAVIVSHLRSPRLPGAAVPQHEEWLV